MNMEKSVNGHWKNLWVNIGWYSGDPFKVISLTIGETMEAYNTRKIDQITFFNFQFLYFVIAFGWCSGL